MPDWMLTNYCLFKNAVILFVLSSDLTFDQFNALISTLQSRAGSDVGSEQKQRYWQVLAERMGGEAALG
jgi:hypothetical protein